MCGRYYRAGSKQQIAERLCAARIAPGILDSLDDWNVAPTTYQPVVRHTRDGAVRELLLMRWGMVPFFAKSLADFRGMSTFNAKAETLPTARTWREPFHGGRRCLVPASGFYEWKVLEPAPTEPPAKKSPKPEKQPYSFTVPAEPTFAFAGLWDAWHDPVADTWLQSFTVITTTPNPLTAQVHTRMPVILHLRDYDEWLLREGPAPTHLLQPFPATEMRMTAVSKDVGNVRNNHPELLNSK